ncbi:Vegetative incompatibility protein HET-E-1 [Tolypocladium ophioglossoides CBS 100239]|uniref:Vegetative incompatibility protein HET-E-1 n=1 Tax=Tolypocladium ophioglossoides (strain CBS 100239) TaxID=1163406 RepID=A0A0L0NA97_TOLOC|nr:Vegetative incompatibility protein HET-E-1 [Tolypocladium ophioglossoides CBS 100239]
MSNAVHSVTADGNARIHVGNVYGTAGTAPRLCLADLRITDPHDDKTRIEDAKGGLLKNSYDWIVTHDDFLRWRNDKHSRLLWIKGDPGKGKTMLLCGIINELQKQKQPASHMSYFFCQGTDSRVNSSTAVLRGLIYLLLFEDANAWVALCDIFSNIVQDPSLKSVYIIIDALDECLTGLEQLLNLIVQYAASSHVKWLVSSRNRHDIERQLKLTDSQTRLCLELKANANQVSHAVDAYIDSRIKQLEYLEDDGALRNRVGQVLRQKSNDTFLWALMNCMIE